MFIVAKDPARIYPSSVCAVSHPATGEVACFLANTYVYMSVPTTAEEMSVWAMWTDWHHRITGEVGRRIVMQCHTGAWGQGRNGGYVIEGQCAPGKCRGFWYTAQMLADLYNEAYPSDTGEKAFILFRHVKVLEHPADGTWSDMPEGFFRHPVVRKGELKKAKPHLKVRRALAWFGADDRFRIAWLHFAARDRLMQSIDVKRANAYAPLPQVTNAIERYYTAHPEQKAGQLYFFFKDE